MMQKRIPHPSQQRPSNGPMRWKADQLAGVQQLNRKQRRALESQQKRGPKR